MDRMDVFRCCLLDVILARQLVEETMSHGLDRINWNNGDETMSHPLDLEMKRGIHD